jgi:hypothetical protein
MSAIVPTIGQKQMASTVAGNTSTETPEPTTAGPQFSEILTGIGSEYGGLSHLFGEGVAAVKPVETSVTVPTDSTVGRLGGLVPKIKSVVAPGPTVQPDSAGKVDSAAPAAAPANLVTRVRAYLKV